MATKNSTRSTTTEAGRIAGALKCMDALRRLERASKLGIQSDRVDRTVAEYYEQRLADVRALVAALGPMTPEAEGALAALAEYIHSSMDGGAPYIAPGYWIPLAAMTDSERQAMFDREGAEHAEIEAQCEVISLDARRAGAAAH